MYKVTSLPNISSTVSSQPNLQLISPGLENSSVQTLHRNRARAGQARISLQPLLKQPKLRNAKKTLCFKSHACSRMVPGAGKCQPWSCFPFTLPRDAVDEVGALGRTQMLCGRDWPGGRCGHCSGFQALMCVCVCVFWRGRGGQDTPGVNKVLRKFQPRLPWENRASPGRRNEEENG